MKSVKEVSFELSGLEIASLTDPTGSTGATLFYFEKGAEIQADLRGGSVATSETSLLDEGSYAAVVDGLVFSGGSTMGLAAGDGVRDVIFQKRKDRATNFDFIPSVPTAVVYDFSTRIESGQDKFVYPTRELGADLMKNLSGTVFLQGRAGAGSTTTANKISNKIWGGQGLAQRDLGFGKVVAGVVVNAVGNIIVEGIKPIDLPADQKIQPGTNTTLSVVITDVKLSRQQLKRMAVMVHTSMARSIFPFHTYYDGDSHFAASTRMRELPPPSGDSEKDHFFELAVAACEAMQDAIKGAVLASNPTFS